MQWFNRGNCSEIAMDLAMYCLQLFTTIIGNKKGTVLPHRTSNPKAMKSQPNPT